MMSNISCYYSFLPPPQVPALWGEKKSISSLCFEYTRLYFLQEVVLSPVNPCSPKEAVMLNWLHDSLHSGFQNLSINQFLSLSAPSPFFFVCSSVLFYE